MKKPVACSRRPSTFAALLVTAALSAQDPKPTAPPAASRLVYTTEIQGPGAWRATFGVTNVGSFLASETGQGLAKQVVGPIEAMAQRALGVDDKAYGLSRERLLDYAGSVVVEVHAFGERSDLVGAFVALTPDGRTDLNRLAADLTELASELDGGHWVDEEGLGGRALRSQSGIVVTAPETVGADEKKACVVAACVPEPFAQRARAEAKQFGERIAARERRPRPPLHVDVDLASTMQFDDLRNDRGFAQTLGANSLRRFEFSVGTAGPHVMLDAALQFEGTSRGLFAVLFPDVQTLPKVAALQPKDATVWKVGHCDLAAIDRMVRDGAKAAGREDSVEGDLPKPLFDEKEGVLPHFTGEYAMFATPRDFEDLGNGDFDFGMLFRIREHEAFATKWKAARKEIGLTELEAETLDGGYVLQRLGGFFQLYCAIGPDLFAIGYGRGMEDALKSAVAAAKDRGFVSKEPTLALPAPLLRHAPKGCNGLAEGDVAVIATQVLWAAGLVVDMGFAGGPPTDLPEVDGEALRATLKEYHLDLARSATGYEAGRWNLRVYW